MKPFYQQLCESPTRMLPGREIHATFSKCSRIEIFLKIANLICGILVNTPTTRVMCAVLCVDICALLAAGLHRLEVVGVALTPAVDELSAVARRPVEPVPRELPLARPHLAVELAVRRPLERGRRDSERESTRCPGKGETGPPRR